MVKSRRCAVCVVEYSRSSSSHEHVLLCCWQIALSRMGRSMPAHTTPCVTLRLCEMFPSLFFPSSSRVATEFIPHFLCNYPTFHCFLNTLRRHLGAFFRQLTPQVVELYLGWVAAAFMRIIICLGTLIAVSLLSFWPLLKIRHTFKCSPFLSGICLELKTDPMHCVPQEVIITKLATWSMNVIQLYLYSY